MIAVLASVIVHSSMMRAMAGARDAGLPASYLTVYRPAELALVALAGLVIGVAGALLPASWAARARTASSLRAQ
jgi:putative ABC transport system permease protein